MRLCGTAGLGFAAPIGLSLDSRARGETLEPPSHEGPYYVVFNAAGGWDTTYLMDPKGVNKINRLYKRGDILTQGNHRFAPNRRSRQSRPEQRGLLQAEYGNDLLVLQRPGLFGQ